MRATLTSARYARLNCPTSCSSCSAVRASSCAEAAISCVDALVCCVEAETCSEEAEDCSATAATWSCPPAPARARGDLLDGGRDLSDPAVHVLHRRAERENASRACSTVATPSSVRRAPSSTTSTARAVSVWISPIEVGDLTGRAPGLLGELAHLVGDDREAAALLAGAGRFDRGVQREQVRLLGDAGDRVDDPADAARTSRPSRDRDARLAGSRSRTASIASRRRATAPPPARRPRGRHRRRPSPRLRCSALSAPAARPRTASGLLDRADLALGALGDLAHGGGDLADGAAGLVGRRRHLLRSGGDRAGRRRRRRRSVRRGGRGSRRRRAATRRSWPGSR